MRDMLIRLLREALWAPAAVVLLAFVLGRLPAVDLWWLMHVAGGAAVAFCYLRLTALVGRRYGLAHAGVRLRGGVRARVQHGARLGARRVRRGRDDRQRPAGRADGYDERSYAERVRGGGVSRLACSHCVARERRAMSPRGARGRSSSRPPCASAVRSTMARPRPEPPCPERESSRRVNGRFRRSTSFGGMPGPWSRTSIDTSGPRASASISTGSPA